MANGFELPSNTGVCEEQKTNRIWLMWFDRIHTICAAAQQAGETADRPVSRLWIGRCYFDETLGKPVWVKSVKPVVWVDASGTPV